MKNNYKPTLVVRVSLCIIVFFPVSISPIAQVNNKLVSGTVTDIENNPLPGVNVLIKNKNRGTTTRLDGSWQLLATPEDTLVFSFLGFKPVNKLVGNKTTINVQLLEDATALDQVVLNAGYYTVTNSEKTGSIATVSANEIENQPVNNPLAAMQGRMSGVSITQNTGVPGGGFNIRIRGRNSIRPEGSEPLYIVDGVPYPAQSLGNFFVSTVFGNSQSPLNGINPSDIKSIEVLKDADATAIYGSRGANGVVLITTKKGKAGKTTVQINAGTGVGTITRKMDLLNTKQYLSMRQEAFANDGIDEYPFNAYDVNGTWSQDRYTDWQEELLGGTAYFTNLKATLTGGSEQTKFLLSGSHQKQTTVFPGDFEYRKSSVLANLLHDSKDKKFNLQFTANYVLDNNDLPTSSFIIPALGLPPNAPALYDENGELNWEDGTFSNPLAQLNGNYRSQSSTLLGNAVIGYNLFKGFTVKTSLGYNKVNLEESRTAPNTIYDPAFGLDSSFSSISTNSGTRDSWIIEPQLEYKTKVGKGKLSMLVGSTFQDEVNTSLYQYGYGFTSNDLIYNLASASLLDILGSSEEQYKYNALYGRVNLNWAGTYFLNLTGRRDGSSRFGPGKQFANFGAVGTAWQFGKEKFIKDIFPFLSYGKLRASYGTSGNDQIGNYGYLDTYVGSGISYQGISGLQPSQLFNPNFGWETNKKTEVAVELGFFKNRLMASAAYYNNRSSSQLVGIPLPGTTGFTSLQGNLDATVQNTGLEIELDAINIKSDALQWSTAVQLTVPRNELISFPGLAESTYSNQYMVGEPLDIALLYNYLGVDPDTGLYTFQDYDGNGIITSPDDKKKATHIGIDYYGGLSNSANYKGVTLNFLFQFVKQTGYNYLNTAPLPGDMVNQSTAVLDHWQQLGDNATTQQYTAGFNDAAYTAYGQLLQSTAIVGDASFIRLKNIALSYTVPTNPTLGVGCRIYILGQNLFTITDYRGMDPETQALDQLPPLKQINAGVELKF